METGIYTDKDGKYDYFIDSEGNSHYDIDMTEFWNYF